MNTAHWQRLGIASKLSVITTLILLTTGLLLFGVTVGQITKATQQELAIRLKARLVWLVSACRDPAITGDFAVIEEVLAEHARLDDARHVSFGDSRGNHMVKNGKELALEAPDWFVNWLGIEHFKGQKIILVGGRNYGDVEVELSPNRAINTAWHNLRTITITSVLALGVMIAAIVFVLRRNLRPLDHLMAGTQAFAAGATSTRLRLDGSHEFRKVIDSFNQMADALETMLEQLRQAKITADAANLAKSRFLATMSHEIRTPMNGILGMAQMLLTPNLTDSQMREYARTILSSGQTLLLLLNDILDLSKIESGKLRLDSTIFEPETLLRETHTLYSGALLSKNLQLSHHWFGPLQQRYQADAHRLRQMLSNLVGNAVKFTQQGQISLHAREVGRDAQGVMLEFAVTDTGIGIPADKLDLLFKPFSQTENSTSREFGGSGLGLSIVANLAKAMAGTVGVESDYGKGSRFWFRVRVSATDKNTEARRFEREAPTTPTVTEPSLEGEVLVVEDNPVNCAVISAMLGQLGLDVSIVNDGQQAVQAMQQGLHHPALILMDLQMPVMDGYHATEYLRRWEAEQELPTIPIIALTADAFDEVRQHCLAVGMNDFLTKPIVMEDLRVAMRKWLPISTPTQH